MTCVVGVTGGIACGKSTLMSYLGQQEGVVVLDADRIAHGAYSRGTACFDRVVANFGQGVVGEDGEVDRKVLGPIVFGDKSKMDLLNSLVWPAIREKLEAEVARQRGLGVPYVVIEAAVMLEAGWADMMDVTWVVCVDPGLAVQRVMSRNKLPQEAAEARVGSQMNNDARLAAAGDATVLWNDGTQDEFKGKVAEAWAAVLKKGGNDGGKEKAGL